MRTDCPAVWPRAIIHLDMNAFFASVEQRDFPELCGRPVGVTNGMRGTCIITCSYEARACGIHTGMRVADARRLCPDFIQRPARPAHYAAISTRIMEALRDVTPQVEIFSVDEAFLDVTGCQRLHGTPLRMARMAEERVREVVGLPCSIGVSGDKTTAKYAANLHKPGGLLAIAPWDAEAVLQKVPVTELSGIADGIGGFLAQHGVRVCGDMRKLPVSVLARRFGNLGRRIWLMCQGRDPTPVQTGLAPPGSIGHGKLMPPDTRDGAVIRTYLEHMSEKVAARLRRHGYEADTFFIGMRVRHGYLGGHYRSAAPTRGGRAIRMLAETMLEERWRGEGVYQVQITALAPQPAGIQPGLFDAANEATALHAVQDRINARYGEFALAPARLLQRTDAPNVIAPSWRPTGLRQTI